MGAFSPTSKHSCLIFEFSDTLCDLSSNRVLSNPTAVSALPAIALNNMCACTQSCLVYCSSHLAVLTALSHLP